MKADNAQGENTQSEPMEFFTTAEAAAKIRMSPATFEAWRVRGGGPEFVKFGRAVRYSRASLEKFAARGARSSTSE